MNQNLFRYELRAHRKSLAFWCLGMVFMLASGMAKMRAYEASGNTINELFSQMPKVFKVLFGAAGNFDLSTARGFYALLFLYLAMMAAIHAVLLGSEIIAKEERDKTAEFLLVKPLARQTILTSKLFAGLVNVSLFWAVTTVSAMVIVGAYNTGPSIGGDILLLAGGLFWIQTIFFAIGFTIAAIRRNARTVPQIAASTILVAYAAYVLVGLFDGLAWLRFLTPFQYFEAGQLLNQGHISPGYIALSIVVAAACIAGAFTGYTRRDQSLN